MGKPIQQGKKPPYFRECPICHKEFGSRSLEIHMSRCLERQKSSSDQVKLIHIFNFQKINVDSVQDLSWRL